MIRLMVPGALPSISTSRGWTTSASAMAGLVTAIRVMSKSVVSTVDRPVVRSTRESTPGGSGACGACGAWARERRLPGRRHDNGEPQCERERETERFHR